MPAHKRFTAATNIQVYFCDPRSPWQRGSNENTSGLLRQYLPRRTDLSRISRSYLKAIALRFNQRPRKTLGFQMPADRLQAVLPDRLNAHPYSEHKADGFAIYQEATPLIESRPQRS
jgi:IS30 family transposase